jgi:hypothetical protein
MAMAGIQRERQTERERERREERGWGSTIAFKDMPSMT